MLNIVEFVVLLNRLPQTHIAKLFSIFFLAVGLVGVSLRWSCPTKHNTVLLDPYLHLLLLITSREVSFALSVDLFVELLSCHHHNLPLLDQLKWHAHICTHFPFRLQSHYIWVVHACWQLAICTCNAVVTESMFVCFDWTQL